MTSTCAHDSKGELSLLVYAQDGGLTSDLKEREVRSETADRNKSEAFHGKQEKREVKRIWRVTSYSLVTDYEWLKAKRIYDKRLLNML